MHTKQTIHNAVEHVKGGAWADLAEATKLWEGEREGYRQLAIAREQAVREAMAQPLGQLILFPDKPDQPDIAA